MRDLYYVSIFNSFFFNTPFPSFSLFLFPSFPLPLPSFSLLLSSFSLFFISLYCFFFFYTLSSSFLSLFPFPLSFLSFPSFFPSLSLTLFHFSLFFLFVETASWIGNISFGKF